MKRYAKPLKSRVSARQPSFFLLLGQKKETKEKAAPYRLDPALLAFGEGFAKGLSCPCAKRAASLPRPWRAVLAKCCDARDGIKGNKPHAFAFSASRIFLKRIKDHISLNRTRYGHKNSLLRRISFIIGLRSSLLSFGSEVTKLAFGFSLKLELKKSAIE